MFKILLIIAAAIPLIGFAATDRQEAKPAAPSALEERGAQKSEAYVNSLLQDPTTLHTCLVPDDDLPEFVDAIQREFMVTQVTFMGFDMAGTHASSLCDYHACIFRSSYEDYVGIREVAKKLRARLRKSKGSLPSPAIIAPPPGVNHLDPIDVNPERLTKR